MSKPRFDPSKPFQPVAKPKFDPSQPFVAPQNVASPGDFSLEDGQTQAVAPNQSATDAAPSRTEALARGAEQGITFGFGDELNGAIQALGQKYLPESWGGSGDSARNVALSNLYRTARDSDRLANARAEAEHKGLYVAGNVLGGLATTPFLPGGGAKALGQVALQGMRTGAIAGGAYGLGASNADLTAGQFGQAAIDTGVGAGLGASLGAAVPLASAGGGWVARNIGAPVMNKLRGGYVVPTPEARALVSEGAQLTLGQMDPNSSIGRLEELSASKFTGGGIADMRARGVATTRDALLKRAAAPGASAPTRGTPVLSQIDEISKGFSGGYDNVLDGVKINPDQYRGQGKWRGLVTDESLTGAAKTKGAFELAANSKNINASDDVRQRALGWLNNEATSIAPTKSGPDAGTVDARAVQELRTRLRDEIRSLGDTGDDRATRQIYQRAENFVTELLEGQLPPENAAKLQSLDASYRNLLALKKAAGGSGAFKEGQGGEFTPTQLLEAIRQKGATPELEDLARNAHRTLSAKYTPTGMMAHGLEAIPAVEYGAQPLSYLINNVPALRTHALRQVIRPGVPARAATLLGRGAENFGMSRYGARSLYELLTAPHLPPSSFAGSDEENRSLAAGR